MFRTEIRFMQMLREIDKSIRPFPSSKENKCEEIFGKSIRSIVHYIKCNIVTMTFTFIIRID